MLSAQEFRQELQRLTSATDVRQAYGVLLELLQDLLNDNTQDHSLRYTSLFTHLNDVCRERGIDAREIDSVRRRARRVLMDKEQATKETFVRDCRTLQSFADALRVELSAEEKDAIAHRQNPFMQTSVLHRETTASNTSLSDSSVAGIRAYVTHMGGYGCSVLTEHGEHWELTVNKELETIYRLLRKGQTLCLLDCDIYEGKLRPHYIIIEPDYLLDISTLSSCMAYYGEEPQNYLLRLFAPAESTPAIMLGNIVNQFVDSVVHAPADKSPEQIRREALRKAFADAPLDFLANSSALDKSFQQKEKEQFQHVYKGIHQQFSSPAMGLQREDIMLEPTLLCPSLGLSGRLDIMSADGQTVVEVKSGKARESTPPDAQRPHRIQMMLYGEMMRRNFGVRVSDLHAYLWYTRYPLMLPYKRSYEALTEALTLRNRIVVMMNYVAEGGLKNVLKLFTPKQLNTRKRHDSIYERLFLPELERVCTPLQQMDEGMSTYFCAFAGFLARELWIGKTTDGRPFFTRGFSRTWTTDAQTKIANGEMLYGLRVVVDPEASNTSDESKNDFVTFEIPSSDNSTTPAFRAGDVVMLYRAEAAGATATNRPLYRAFVASITAHRLTLCLFNPQTGTQWLSPEARFAVEHDHMDVGTTSCYMGLWQLAATDASRRDLLLGRRKPRMKEPQPVAHQTNPQVDDIVSRALASEDYFLLVGPPGTGKTSVALRALTLNYVASAQANQGLLLSAYTNRAVDEICGMLESAQVPYVRIGGIHSCAEQYRHRLLCTLVEGRDRASLLRLLDTSPVVVGTVLTLSRRMSLFRIKRFGMAIIDEASQILEPQLLTLLSATNDDGSLIVPRFLMIGDHKQLPAVVLQSEKESDVSEPVLHDMELRNLRSSLFERLHRLALREGCEAFTATLTHQGRMHPDIADYASDMFYGGVLDVVPLPHQRVKLDLPEPQTNWERFVAHTRMGFVDVMPQSAPTYLKANNEEAEVTAQVVEAVTALYSKAETDFSPSKRIGVIVPFRAQINHVRNALRRKGVPEADLMTIDTVECYQGSQRDIIVFCTTVWRPWQLSMISAPVEVGGISVDRKLNVAVTRAREQFFLVGNASLLRENPLYARLIDRCTPMPKA